MYKTKIFSGMNPDIAFELWVEKHPNAVIQSFHFSRDRPGNFGICILYTEDSFLPQDPLWKSFLLGQYRAGSK